MNINIISDLRHLFCNIRPRNTLTCLMFATSDAHSGACPRWVQLSCQYVFCHTVKFDDSALIKDVPWSQCLDLYEKRNSLLKMF